MSLIRRTSPAGIDAYIDRLQPNMYIALSKVWGTTDSTFNCYPRCYRNQDTDQKSYTAQLYLGDNQYSPDVYLDDTVAVTSFFGLGIEEPITGENMNAVSVHVVFFVNLSLIRQSTNRTDAEVRQDVQKVLNSYGAARGFTLTKQSTSLEKVLAEYPGTRQTVALKGKAPDMQPYHCFRFDMMVYYQPTHTGCGED